MPTTVEETEKKETREDKKDELLLDSLEIKGYRCFEHLTIEKLGRVNLIVGKNNVGKTALLEALLIYSQRGKINSLLEALHLRNQIPKSNYTPSGENLIRPNDLNLNYLFHPAFDRKFIISKFHDESNKLEILLRKVGTKVESIENGKIVETEIKEFPISLSPNEKILISHFGNIPTEFFSLDRFINLVPPNSTRAFEETSPVPNFFIRASVINNISLERVWDLKIVGTNLKSLVLKSLQIVESEIEDIFFLNQEFLIENEQISFIDSSNTIQYLGKIPAFRKVNSDSRLPLSQLGDGMSRLLGIALGLVNCQDGILLIDELENGLHYSIQPDVWKLIFKTAKDLNVQVFATTHSKDCIEAFTQAAIDDEESDGMLIRLENKDGTIRAVNFNEDELETVERRNIEVR